jgi:hypothetical protein
VATAAWVCFQVPYSIPLVHMSVFIFAFHVSIHIYYSTIHNRQDMETVQIPYN